MPTSSSAELPESIAIEARALRKVFRLGEHHSLAATMRALAGRRRSDDRPLLEALKEVSFTVETGECVGIVGMNGSGKSTLLEILAGITVPSAGELMVRGTVLPLFAVGSGFHPELTGRENVELFGTILGLKRAVIAGHVDRIAAFAEVERHLDTPTKRYSDGMQARLSFAVAMCFPADCYIFDEVLAVVDGDFRDRCLTEIGALRDSGATVVFVSHSLEQTAALCSRVLWLQDGSLVRDGTAGEIIPAYEISLHSPGHEVLGAH